MSLPIGDSPRFHFLLPRVCSTQESDSPEEQFEVIPDDLPATQPYEADEGSFSSLSSAEGEEYETPKRRVPPLGKYDSAIADQNGPFVSVHGQIEFVSPQELLKIHRMKFISYGRVDKSKEVIAVSSKGKHVLLQQATRSCVPTAISMLALDLERKPLFAEMGYGNPSTDEKESRFIQKAGLKSTIHPLSGDQMEKAVKLESFLRKGPGLLSILHPEVGSHQVVLDAISFAKKRVTFRDPYHGWMVDVRLDAFMPWIGDCFQVLEVAKPHS